MSNILNLTNLNKVTITELIDLAVDIKRNPQAYADALKNKKLYMLFEKTSTRTFLSFAQGITEMGGTYYSQNWCDSNFCVGDLKSESQYVSRNNDIIMMRLKNHETLTKISEYSTSPLINGCDNTWHPCQGLADFMTIYEDFGHYNIKLMYIGARNNVFHSLLELTCKLGGTLYGVTPIINKSAISSEFYETCTASGHYIELSPAIEPEQLNKEIQSMDAVYTDTWIDMEFFNDPSYQAKKKEVCSKMLPLQLNDTLLAGSSALVFHDMPIHIGYEISQSIADKHIDHILTQAENRKHAQKALMLYLLQQ